MSARGQLKRRCSLKIKTDFFIEKFSLNARKAPNNFVLLDKQDIVEMPELEFSRWQSDTFEARWVRLSSTVLYYFEWFTTWTEFYLQVRTFSGKHRWKPASPLIEDEEKRNIFHPGIYGNIRESERSIVRITAGDHKLIQFNSKTASLKPGFEIFFDVLSEFFQIWS